MPTRLPPGPHNINAPLGLTWRHYLQLRLNPIGFASRLTRKYGDISYFKIFRYPACFVNSPKLIREVLVSQSSNFPKFERITNHLRQATGEGLLVTEGSVWRNQRQAAQRALRSQRMEFFNQLTCDHTQGMIDRWHHRPSVMVEHELTQLLQDVIGEGFFGPELGRNQQIADAVRESSDVFHHESRALFNWPDWLPTRRKKMKHRSNAFLKGTLRNIIQNRLQEGSRREDLLDILLFENSASHSRCPFLAAQSHEDDATRISRTLDQLLTMYVAGFHTTSVSLAWTFYLVAQHPHIQQQLHRELASVCGGQQVNPGHLPRLELHEMVVRESLRLYPAAWELFARQAVQPCQLDGYDIPAGSLILIMPIVTHRDARFFEQPLTFDPWRFSAERECDIVPYSYIPFGAGPHVCIGNSLSKTQMTLILSSVLQRFELSHRANRPVEIVPRVSARPANDICLTLRSQSPQLVSEQPAGVQPVSHQSARDLGGNELRL